MASDRRGSLSTQMLVHLINQLDEFNGLRTSWDAAFAADPSATVFLSWSWLRGWFETSPHPWAVLAAKPRGSDAWVGFMPISVRGGAMYRFDQVREIRMAGEPAADYTGFVCDPRFEQEGVRAFADFIVHRMQWDRLRLKEINDPRMDWFVEALPSRSVQVYEGTGTCCPYIPLPASWDDYLQNCLTYETRKSLRKKLRLVERECRVTHLNGDNATDQIEALLKLASLKDHHAAENSVPRFRAIFRSCAEAGFASVTIVWKADAPIAGMGSFIDAKAGSLDFYVTGYDEQFGEYSPGRVVNALCIQHAIDRKLKVLDFLRGDEPYKFQFGAQRRYTRNVTMLRRGLHTATRIAVNRVRQKLPF